MVVEVADLARIEVELEAVHVAQVHEVEGVADREPGGDLEDVRATRVELEIVLRVVADLGRAETGTLAVVGPDEAEALARGIGVDASAGRIRPCEGIDAQAPSAAKRKW
ncbi:MAG: hypothetical protein R3E53_13345 [Myxococcota bacterium]